MSTVSPTARRELVRVLAERYAVATKVEEARILDEFVAIAGYHRNHAVRLLTAEIAFEVAVARVAQPRVCDEAVRQALVVLWEAADRICGKRLKPLLPLLVPSLERHEHLRLDRLVRSELLVMGTATIDRLFAGSPAFSARSGAFECDPVRDERHDRPFAGRFRIAGWMPYSRSVCALRYGNGWWVRRDSNPEPMDYESEPSNAIDRRNPARVRDLNDSVRASAPESHAISHANAFDPAADGVSRAALLARLMNSAARLEAVELEALVGAIEGRVGPSTDGSDGARRSKGNLT